MLIKYALEKAFKHFNFKYKEDYDFKNYRLINKQIWIEYENGQIDSKNLRIERFKRLFENYEEKIDFNEFSKIYLSLLGDGAEDVCKYISGKYKIVILTNGIKEVQLSRIKNSPLNKYIHDIITSEEIGYKNLILEFFTIPLTTVQKESTPSSISGGNLP